MNSSPENSAADSSAAASPSALAGGPACPPPEPPPLPQQIQRFQAACWMGIAFGTLLTFFDCVALFLIATTAGPAASNLNYGVTLASAVQALSAWLLLRRRQSVLPVFATASILGAFGYIAFATSVNSSLLARFLFLFAALSFVPLLLLMLGARQKGPSSMAPTEGGGEAGPQDTFSTSVPKGEDLY